jgi:hypothetical protein
MKNTVFYEGNVVQFRKNVNGTNKDTSFQFEEVDIINRIELNNTLTILFNSGKVLIKDNIINYNSWFKRHFKILI